MLAQHVRAFTQVRNCDSDDAAAISENCQQPALHPVSVTAQQQDLSLRPRIRAGLVTQRTALIDFICGMLPEYSDLSGNPLVSENSSFGNSSGCSVAATAALQY